MRPSATHHVLDPLWPSLTICDPLRSSATCSSADLEVAAGGARGRCHDLATAADGVIDAFHLFGLRRPFTRGRHLDKYFSRPMLVILAAGGGAGPAAARAALSSRGRSVYPLITAEHRRAATPRGGWRWVAAMSGGMSEQLPPWLSLATSCWERDTETARRCAGRCPALSGARRLPPRRGESQPPRGSLDSRCETDTAL